MVHAKTGQWGVGEESNNIYITSKQTGCERVRERDREGRFVRKDEINMGGRTLATKNIKNNMTTGNDGAKTLIHES